MPDKAEKDSGLELLVKLLEKADRATANWIRVWISEFDPENAAIIQNADIFQHPPESADDVSAQITQAIAEFNREERMRIAQTLSRVLESLGAMD